VCGKTHLDAIELKDRHLPDAFGTNGSHRLCRPVAEDLSDALKFYDAQNAPPRPGSERLTKHIDQLNLI